MEADYVHGVHYTPLFCYNTSIMEETLQKPTLSPKFFFISLGVIITLITSVSTFLSLLFETLNKRFPDVLNSTYTYGYNTYSFDTLRATLATLIIVFPVFIALSYFWNRSIKQGLSRSDLFVFKWMLYIIIFLSSIVVVVDLVTLVKYFVSGEITMRFIMKVIGALLIACLVGWYYIYELKNYNNSQSKKIVSKIILGLSLTIFIALVVWSFSVMGSPAKQRAWRMDDRRISDLQSIQSQIISYWQQKEKLPERLSDLANPMTGYSLPVDPEFEKGNKYEYSVKDKLSFELCATFLVDMPKGWQENGYGGVMPMYEKGMDISVSSYPYYGGMNESWDHTAGRTCFERTIDPDVYPPFEKPKGI